jgi:hypothetical protein
MPDAPGLTDIQEFMKNESDLSAECFIVGKEFLACRIVVRVSHTPRELMDFHWISAQFARRLVRNDSHPAFQLSHKLICIQKDRVLRISEQFLLLYCPECVVGTGDPYPSMMFAEKKLQKLHQKFYIDESARTLLNIVVRRVFLPDLFFHSLPHASDILSKGCLVCIPINKILNRGTESRSDRPVACHEPGPQQGLQFPCLRL